MDARRPRRACAREPALRNCLSDAEWAVLAPLKVEVCERLARALMMGGRAGREASPTGAVLNAQAARSGGVGMAGGYDPARQVVGRKRHALTDTDGRLLIAAVSPADLQTATAASRCCATCAACAHSWRTALPIAPTAGTVSVRVPPSRWRSSSPRRVRGALPSSRCAAGWLRGPLAGSAAADGWARDHEATTSSALAFFVLTAAMILVRRIACPK